MKENLGHSSITFSSPLLFTHKIRRLAELNEKEGKENESEVNEPAKFNHDEGLCVCHFLGKEIVGGWGLFVIIQGNEVGGVRESSALRNRPCD